MHGRGGRRATSDESRGHSEVPACLRVHVCGPAAECLHYYALVSVCVSLSVCVSRHGCRMSIRDRQINIHMISNTATSVSTCSPLNERQVVSMQMQ